eukprot:TRINITY_DN14454_c0_g1_i1.p1 TRINITY_DN14454_c0_g1~~TRINITY_DN14454_c0_g1_i1.p1  ORF type:complete len:494 (-),score=163.60 TRINITY_DN14454_c0_g1_i1:122-1510(-)
MSNTTPRRRTRSASRLEIEESLGRKPLAEPSPDVEPKSQPTQPNASESPGVRSPPATETSTSDMEAAQERYRKFFTRSISGLVMILVFAIILYSSHFLVSLFVVVLQVVVFKEIIALRYIEAKEKKLWGFRTLHWYFLLCSFIYVYSNVFIDKFSKVIPAPLVDIMVQYQLATPFVLYVAGAIFFILTLRKNKLRYQFGQLTWTLMTLLVVVGQSHTVILNIFKGLFWFLLPCSCIICNDIMAYFVGFAFGRKFVNKRLTKLSPNKTWEGFIGALILTVIWAFFFSQFLAQYDWFVCPRTPYDSVAEGFLGGDLNCARDSIFNPKIYELPTVVTSVLSLLGSSRTTVTLLPVQLHSIVFGLFASLVAPFGGFFASAMKRAFKIKDFDNLFPGHGGVTDRMDCQLIMGLFTYVYRATFVGGFVAVGLMGANYTVEQIFQHVQRLSADDQRRLFGLLNQTLSQA